MGRRIVLLLHEADGPRELAFYSVGRYVPVWEADGHEVRVLYGPGTSLEADLVFVHVDLSEVPEAYLAFAARFPASVNGRVRSILKRDYSPNVLGPGDAWPGAVMVKSNRNFGGYPESQRGVARLDGRGFAAPFQTPFQYQLFESLAQVPATAFESPDYLVQAFTPELEDGLFHVRTYTFLGDWGECRRLGSEHPVVKAETKVTSAPAPVDPRVEALRRERGLDYGKIDYLYHQGELVVLDLNKTIGSRGPDRASNPHMASTRAARARGLYALFP